MSDLFRINRQFVKVEHEHSFCNNLPLLQKTPASNKKITSNRNIWESVLSRTAEDKICKVHGQFSSGDDVSGKKHLFFFNLEEPRVVISLFWINTESSICRGWLSYSVWCKCVIQSVQCWLVLSLIAKEPLTPSKAGNSDVIHGRNISWEIFFKDSGNIRTSP